MQDIWAESLTQNFTEEASKLDKSLREKLISLREAESHIRKNMGTGMDVVNSTIRVINEFTKAFDWQSKFSGEMQPAIEALSGFKIEASRQTAELTTVRDFINSFNKVIGWTGTGTQAEREMRQIYEFRSFYELPTWRPRILGLTAADIADNSKLNDAAISRIVDEYKLRGNLVELIAADKGKLIFQYIVEGQSFADEAKLSAAMKESLPELKARLVNAGVDSNFELQANPVKIHQDKFASYKEPSVEGQATVSTILEGAPNEKVNMAEIGGRLAESMGISSNGLQKILERLVNPDWIMRAKYGRHIGQTYIPFSGQAQRNLKIIKEFRNAAIPLGQLQQVFSNQTVLTNELDNYKRLEKMADDIIERSFSSEVKDRKPILAAVQSSQDGKLLEAIIKEKCGQQGIHIAEGSIDILDANIARSQVKTNEMLSRGGVAGHITIATVAGRGTDIKMIADFFGIRELFVAVQGRDVSERIDIQVQFRTARNGQGGEITFYLAPGDKCFGDKSRRDVLATLVLKDGESVQLIEEKINKVIEIQRENEAKAFKGVLKNLTQYEVLTNSLVRFESIRMDLADIALERSDGKPVTRDQVQRLLRSYSELVLNATLSPYEGKPLTPTMLTEIAHQLTAKLGVDITIYSREGASLANVKESVLNAIVDRLSAEKMTEANFDKLLKKLNILVNDSKAEMIQAFDRLKDNVEQRLTPAEVEERLLLEDKSRGSIEKYREVQEALSPKGIQKNANNRVGAVPVSPQAGKRLLHKNPYSIEKYEAVQKELAPREFQTNANRGAITEPIYSPSPEREKNIPVNDINKTHLEKELALESGKVLAKLAKDISGVLHESVGRVGKITVGVNPYKHEMTFEQFKNLVAKEGLRDITSKFTRQPDLLIKLLSSEEGKLWLETKEGKIFSSNFPKETWSSMPKALVSSIPGVLIGLGTMMEIDKLCDLVGIDHPAARFALVMGGGHYVNQLYGVFEQNLAKGWVESKGKGLSKERLPYIWQEMKNSRNWAAFRETLTAPGLVQAGKGLGTMFTRDALVAKFATSLVDQSAQLMGYHLSEKTLEYVDLVNFLGIPMVSHHMYSRATATLRFEAQMALAQGGTLAKHTQAAIIALKELAEHGIITTEAIAALPAAKSAAQTASRTLALRGAAVSGVLGVVGGIHLAADLGVFVDDWRNGVTNYQQSVRQRAAESMLDYYKRLDSFDSTHPERLLNFLAPTAGAKLLASQADEKRFGNVVSSRADILKEDKAKAGNLNISLTRVLLEEMLKQEIDLNIFESATPSMFSSTSVFNSLNTRRLKDVLAQKKEEIASFRFLGEGEGFGDDIRKIFDEEGNLKDAEDNSKLLMWISSWKLTSEDIEGVLSTLFLKEQADFIEPELNKLRIEKSRIVKLPKPEQEKELEKLNNNIQQLNKRFQELPKIKTLLSLMDLLPVYSNSNFSIVDVFQNTRLERRYRWLKNPEKIADGRKIDVAVDLNIGLANRRQDGGFDLSALPKSEQDYLRLRADSIRIKEMDLQVKIDGLRNTLKADPSISKPDEQFLVQGGIELVESMREVTMKRMLTVDYDIQRLRMKWFTAIPEEKTKIMSLLTELGDKETIWQNSRYQKEITEIVTVLDGSSPDELTSNTRQEFAIRLLSLKADGSYGLRQKTYIDRFADSIPDLGELLSSKRVLTPKEIKYLVMSLGFYNGNNAENEESEQAIGQNAKLKEMISMRLFALGYNPAVFQMIDQYSKEKGADLNAFKALHDAMVLLRPAVAVKLSESKTRINDSRVDSLLERVKAFEAILIKPDQYVYSGRGDVTLLSQAIIREHNELIDQWQSLNIDLRKELGVDLTLDRDFASEILRLDLPKLLTEEVQKNINKWKSIAQENQLATIIDLQKLVSSGAENIDIVETLKFLESIADSDNIQVRLAVVDALAILALSNTTSPLTKVTTAKLLAQKFLGKGIFNRMDKSPLVNKLAYHVLSKVVRESELIKSERKGYSNFLNDLITENPGYGLTQPTVDSKIVFFENK